MDNFNVYKDIQARTSGEIYIGVVGPVRISESTLTKRFMGLLVLPVMENKSLRNLSRDELSQSAAGKTAMITEPKLIPEETARINPADGIEAKVRVTDCVGFMVDGVAGHVENDEERLMKASWFGCDIPFIQVTEIGTKKVINDHSIIGIVVITDGTIGEIKHPGYIAAEKQTIDELKKLGKPFVVLLNSTRPCLDETTRLTKEISESYGVSMPPVNYEQLKEEGIFHIPERVLKEFLVTEMDFHILKWLEILPSAHWFKAQIIQAARNTIQKVVHMKDMSGGLKQQHTDAIRSMNMKNIQMVGGRVDVQADIDDSYYYQIPSDYVGLPIEGEYQLMQTPSNLVNMQKEYEEVQNVLTRVRLKGYGVVAPGHSEVVLDGPQVIKHGSKYGVKMKMGAPSINLIKAHTETEIALVVENEQQAQDPIAYAKENARESDDGIQNTNIFGKSIEQIVEDGIQVKVSQTTESYQLKLQDTLRKIINDSNGGTVRIII